MYITYLSIWSDFESLNAVTLIPSKSCVNPAWPDATMGRGILHATPAKTKSYPVIRSIKLESDLE